MPIKTLYVGNLPYSTTADELLAHFSDYEPRNPRIIEGKGFAFVDIASGHIAVALEAMNESELGGRRLKVHEARPKGEVHSSAPAPVHNSEGRREEYAGVETDWSAMEGGRVRHKGRESRSRAGRGKYWS